MIDCMTGFPVAAYLGKDIDSSVVAIAAFNNFSLAIGLPQSIFVDDEGVFEALFRERFKLLPCIGCCP
jgi:hypothetical protein